MKHSRKTFKAAAYNNREALQLYIKRCEELKDLIREAYHEGLIDMETLGFSNWNESEAKKELGK